jgi:hypothetical protein
MPQSDDAVEAREGYERKTAALIGQRITGVTYWDVYNYSGSLGLGIMATGTTP